MLVFSGLRYLLILLTVLILSGCLQETPKSTLEDYRDRVANVLDMDVPAITSEPTVRLPARRDRTWPTEELRAGVLDSIEFKQCDLLPLIVERNSSLGKVMQPSTLMSYELRFFARLLPCYQAAKRTEFADTEEDFRALLAATYTNKSSNLEAVVWNGIFTSDEMAKQFSASAEPIPLEGNPGFKQSLRSLKYLVQLTDSVESFRATERIQLPGGLATQEDHYFSLYGSEYGAQLQASLLLLIRNLHQVAAIINDKLERRPLCFNEQSNAKADILLNVFQRYYAGNVQPYMAMVQQQGLPWFEQMNKLLSFGGKQRPAAMQTFQQQVYSMDSTSSLWQQYQTAIRAHTKAWQRILGQCGLMPG